MTDGAKKLGDGKTRPPSIQGHKIDFKSVEPWDDAVTGEELIEEIIGSIRKYVVLPESSCVAVSLWVIHTHCFEAFHITPILAILSPEKQCGKTTLLDVLLCLVNRPMPTSNITTSAVFRVIESSRPTLLIDEADTFLRDNEELRGILNSGHRKGGQVVRTVGENLEVRSFSTYCPKSIALIGKLPDTLQDRSLSILLQRRSRDEVVDRFRSNRISELEATIRKIARWAQDHIEALRIADPELPDFLYNRAADNWSPVLAIADEIGNGWGDKARKAAQEISQGNADDTGSIRTLLLADIKDIFEARRIDRLTSKDLVAALLEIEDRPWAEWKGKSLSTNQLANLLRSFGIASGTIRPPSGNTAKGYKRDQFLEAWKHYLPSCDAQNADVTACDVSENARNPNETNACDVVTPYDGCSPEDDEIPF